MDRRSFLLAAAAAPFALRGARVRLRHRRHRVARRRRRPALRHRRCTASPTQPDPRSVERVGDVAVVAHTAVGAVSILDGLGVRHVLDGFEEPRYTAGSRDGRHAFVTDSGARRAR